MSLIFISNLNHVLKKIKFIFNFKNKMKIKIFHVAEHYHLPSIIISTMVYICSNKTIYYLKKTVLILQRDLYQQCKENKWTKFGLESL